MKKNLLMVPLAFVFMAATCSKSSNINAFAEKVDASAPPPPPAPPVPPPPPVAWTFTANATTIDFEDMDPSADPRSDFFEFANGSWLKKTDIPASESSYGKFNVLADNNNKVLRSILETAASQKNEPGTVYQLIGDFYFAVMDSARREAEGVKPLQEEFNKINQLKDVSGLARLMAHQHNIGIGTFFGFGVEQDLKDNTKMALYNAAGGLSLPSCEYYTKKDTASEKIKTAYKEHLQTMFGLMGYNAGDAKKAANDVFNIECLLADSSLTPLEERNIEASYNKMTWAQLQKMIPGFNLDVYAREAGLRLPVGDVIVTVPKFMRQFEYIIKNRSVAEIKNYMKWRTLHACGDKLSIKIEKQEFAFFGSMLRGAKEMKPMWKRSISAIGNSAIGEALGHAFVDKQFSPVARQRVNEMVDNIFEAFKLRLDTLEWMSPETRKKAHEKLASFIRKMGYPEKWTDYSGLTITRSSYVQNAFACNQFSHKENIGKLYKPIEKTDWQMPAHVVNAYYNPLWNEIVFPAGIMQPPFFDVTKEDAVNYARMGAVIGHELTHGFDDQGAQFDAGGNLSNWWTESDLKNFKERTQKLIDCFDSYEALPGLHVNGSLTIGENIADLGGLKIAYYAYQRSLNGKKRETINGFTPEQRFFIAFGQIWCSKYTDKALKNQIYTNVHAPGKYRVLGPLSNMEEFFEAFNVKSGDKMRMPEDKRARIW